MIYLLIKHTFIEPYFIPGIVLADGNQRKKKRKQNGDPSLKELTLSWGEIKNKQTNQYVISETVISAMKKK